MASPALARGGHASPHAALRVHTSGPTGATRRLPTIYQTLNNCGPASIAEVLSLWGVERTQSQVAEVVRADGGPHGMAPFGIPAYARGLGLEAMIGVDGTERLVRALVSNGFPVIVSEWVSLDDHIRHYRPIWAYSDRRSVFVSSDPYLGADHAISYGDFTRLWSVSDGRFVVIFPRSRARLLAAVLAEAGWNHDRAFRHDLAWQRSRLAHPASDVPAGVLRYYGLPSLAWDQMELGQTEQARRTLAQAARQGASPIVLGWIEREMLRRVRPSAHRS